MDESDDFSVKVYAALAQELERSDILKTAQEGKGIAKYRAWSNGKSSLGPQLSWAWSRGMGGPNDRQRQALERLQAACASNDEIMTKTIAVRGEDAGRPSGAALEADEFWTSEFEPDRFRNDFQTGEGKKQGEKSLEAKQYEQLGSLNQNLQRGDGDFFDEASVPLPYAGGVGGGGFGGQAFGGLEAEGEGAGAGAGASAGKGGGTSNADKDKSASMQGALSMRIDAFEPRGNRAYFIKIRGTPRLSMAVAETGGTNWLASGFWLLLMLGLGTTLAVFASQPNCLARILHWKYIFLLAVGIALWLVASFVLVSFLGFVMFAAGAVGLGWERIVAKPAV